MKDTILKNDVIVNDSFLVNMTLSFYKIREFDIIYSITVKEKKLKRKDFKNSWYEQEHTRKYVTANVAYEIYTYLKSYYENLKNFGDNDIRTVCSKSKLRKNARLKEWK